MSRRKPKQENIDLLRLMEQRMIAIELAGEGIGIVDSNGVIDFVNKALADMYGYDSWQDIVGMPWKYLASDDEKEKTIHEILPTLRVQKTWVGQTIGKRRDGKTFHKDMTVSALPDGRWIFLVRDITKQISLADTAKNRLAAMEAAGDGIGLVDVDGNLTYMNKALKDLHQFHDDDLKNSIGHSWTHLYTQRGQEKIRKEMSLTMLDDGGMIGTARDITDKINAEQERKKLERQFYQAQKMEAVGRLVGGIAHDFNNLLASMMGYADFLMDDLPPDGKSHHYAKSIYEGGFQARQVIDRLLTFSRTQDHDVECIDVVGLIDNSINLMRSGLNANVSIIFSGDEHPILSGDHTLISQAIMNLLVNARDAIGDQDGKIIVSLKSSVFYARDHLDGVLSGKMKDGAEYVQISVRDNGCGMNKIMMDHIFDPFFTTKPVDQGTGLGLASVHGIMQTHKGAVYVTSKIGQGAEFRLYFPVCPDDKIRRLVNQCRSLPDVSSATLTGVRIMLVEDMPDVGEMLKIMLERAGGKVDIFQNGIEAEKKLSQSNTYYNLVITDQTMPEMSGLDLARRIHNYNPGMPIILISGYSQHNLKQQIGLQDHVRAIIKKPIERKLLFDAIELCLGGSVATAIEAAPTFPPPSGNQGAEKQRQT